MAERIKFGERGEGSLMKFPGSANWYSAICIRGKEHCQSTHTPDLKLARRRHRQILDELAADRQGFRRFIGPVAAKVTVSELLDDLGADYRLRGKARSWKNLGCHIKPLLEHLGHWRATGLTAEAVDAFIESLLKQGLAPATVNRSTQLLHQTLKLALERQRIASRPKVRCLPEKNVRQGFFERPEFEAVVAALPDHLQDFARFAYLTGWRKGEITSLRWSDVDRDGGAIRLRPEAAKNGRGRTVMLDGDLAPLMERRYQARLLEKHGTVRVVDWVFHRAGEPIGEFRTRWARACRAAGVEGRFFHDLRRTAIRNMVRAGVREGVAMAISGHRTRSVFDRYNITSEDDLREAAERTTRYLDTLPTSRSQADQLGH